MAKKKEILIIDDHPVIAVAVNLLVTDNIPNVNVEQIDTGKEGLAMIKKKEYDLVVLDVNLPDYNILALIPNIFSARPDCKILIFTISPENILARRLFSMDISGFLHKSVSDEEIVKAVRTVLEGGKYISPTFSEQVVKDFLEGKKNINPFDDLSDREYQVMVELLNGVSTKDISEKLHLNGSSIATYRQRIFKKIDVENNVELYKKAQFFGIVD